MESTQKLIRLLHFLSFRAETWPTCWKHIYDLKGGGGGGFSPDFCENTILRYELAMMARTFSSKEIELSFLIHSFRLDEIVILVYSFVKIG